MPAKLEAKERSLVNIFNNDYLFQIPDYQRPYVWTTEQTSELLDDLLDITVKDEELVDDLLGPIKNNDNETVNTLLNKLPPYFFGSIVIIKGTEPHSEVVDGQQRLTTLTILFCVLRELFDKENYPNSIDQRVREISDLQGGTTGQFRLSVRDKVFFQKNVQEKSKLRHFIEHPPSDLSYSQQRMFENTKHLWQELSKYGSERLDMLARFIIQRCYLVVVSASDSNSAYRIFSVLNDRGLDLSPTDILKANIIGAMDNKKERKKYNDEWESVENELGRDDFRALFAHIRMIYMKAKGRKELSEEFREGVLNRVSKENKNFIDDVLIPFSDTYEIVSRAAYESPSGADEVNCYLKHLNRLNNSDWIPPAMAFFKCNKSNTNALIQFTQDLERLAYGMFITRKNVHYRISRYAQVLRTIENNEDRLGDDSPLQLSSKEKEEILRVLDGRIYSLPNVPRPLLLRLDSLLAEQEVSYGNSVTIEHVLPQNPKEDSEWIKWFPDKEQREEWTHKIANLVLLSRRKNTQASNYEFDRKKREYFQQNGVTTFALTTQVVNEKEWTPKVLERRQEELIDKLKKEWRLA